MIFKVSIPVEAVIYVDVEANTEEEALEMVENNTSMYMLTNTAEVEVVEFDHRGDIELVE